MMAGIWLGITLAASAVTLRMFVYMRRLLRWQLGGFRGPEPRCWPLPSLRRPVQARAIAVMSRDQLAAAILDERRRRAAVRTAAAGRHGSLSRQQGPGPVRGPGPA